MFELGFETSTVVSSDRLAEVQTATTRSTGFNLQGPERHSGVAAHLPPRLRRRRENQSVYDTAEIALSKTQSSTGGAVALMNHRGLGKDNDLSRWPLIGSVRRRESAFVAADSEHLVM